MKFIKPLLAALLLLTFIACTNGTNKGKSKTSNIPLKVQELQVESSESSPQQDALANVEFSPPKIVKDDETKIDAIAQDGVNDQGLADTQKPPASFNTDEYDLIVENDFLATTQNPLSTFSIDVDEAAYSNVRRYLNDGSLPPAGAVRIEEMINYFDYEYSKPTDGSPFAVNTEIADCPWNTRHKLVHVGLKGKEISIDNLPAANLVFLIDVSGSMDEENRLPLVKSSLKMLTDQLREKDKVAIVVYAGNAGLVLPSTSGSNKAKIKEAIDNLEAGGSTAGGEGIQLAYKTAGNSFVEGGNNRIILATDGDFNVGPSSDDQLVRIIEEQRKTGVFLSVLGYGMGNYKDGKMQQLADKGNGNHSYIDNINEARKVLVSEFGSTLFTIAKDVKIQIEFNPAKVQAYRLIGYENRMLAAESFNDDLKDAGEIGSGHTVTALYEIIPVGVKDSFSKRVNELKYHTSKQLPVVNNSNEMMTIQIRYKKPEEEISKLVTHPVLDNKIELASTSDNFRFSAAVAEFGLLLRSSAYKQEASYQQVVNLAKNALGKDEHGYRIEFVKLVEAANSMVKK
jgi:Ca-activated chloride channel homolog